MRKNTMIGLGAMVLVIVSTMFPMISGNEMVEKMSSLWTAGDDSSSTVAIIILVLAVLMGLFSFLANKKHLASIGTLIFSGLLLLISMKWFRDMGEGGGMFSYGLGLILFLIGSSLGAISSILGFMKK